MFLTVQAICQLSVVLYIWRFTYQQCLTATSTSQIIAEMLMFLCSDHAVNLCSTFSAMTLLVGSIFHMTRKIVSEMTYNVSMGTLNPTIPYYTMVIIRYYVCFTEQWMSTNVTCPSASHYCVVHASDIRCCIVMLCAVAELIDTCLVSLSSAKVLDRLVHCSELLSTSVLVKEIAA